MNTDTASKDTAPAGNWQEWHAIWAELKSGGGDMLFTPGRPQNLLEFWQRCYFEDLWGLLGHPGAGVKCVELGSGRGTTSMYLTAQGCDVTMVDLSPAAFEQAARNFRQTGLPLPRMVLADACNTGLPSESCDCVYNIGLLEHFEDPAPVLRESWRLLRQGGLLFSVIVPQVPASRRWLAELLFVPWRLLLRPARSCAKRFLRRSQTVPLAGEMVRTDYTRQHYERWMQNIGAADVRCVPYNPYHGLWKARLSIGPLLPLYRLHHSLKRKAPKLQTWPSVAMCDLLWGRKP